MNNAALGALDVFVVTYRPDHALLGRAIEGLVSQRDHGFAVLNLHVWDNTQDRAERQKIASTLAPFASNFGSVRVDSSGSNLGFGQGNNRLLAQSAAPWIFLLNQDAIPEPGALSAVSAAIVAEKGRVAVWEMRQIPYEHPKIYDPSSLVTSWVSGAACLVRRSAMESVNGFDAAIFMYAEDVDFSWRLRAKGWELKYLPRAAVFHDTYSRPGEEKPLQAVEGTLTNLLLRARFGSWFDVLVGLLGVGRQLVAPATFPGRRAAFAAVLPRFLRRAPTFRRSGAVYRGCFKPEFRGWDYALRRDGAFFPFRRRREWDELPLVSIVVRTHKRPAMLREALQSLVNQTYPNLEIVVVEDGQPCAEGMIEAEFGSVSNLRYIATGENVGRSRAGNIGLSMATGQWLGFLDDDDQLFADHVEVLLQSALTNGVRGAYGIAWEVVSEVRSASLLEYEEKGHFVRYRQPFSRPLMWYCNYLPIQSVIFHRSLYEMYGGFAEDMDQLEDWNLWTRYTLEYDFVFVEKTTSKYRVPSSKDDTDTRQNKLDDAYAQAIARQAVMEIRVSPRDFVRMAEEYSRNRALLTVSSEHVKNALRRVGTLNLARRVKRRILTRFQRGTQ